MKHWHKFKQACSWQSEHLFFNNTGGTHDSASITKSHPLFLRSTHGLIFYFLSLTYSHDLITIVHCWIPTSCHQATIVLHSALSWLQFMISREYHKHVWCYWYRPGGLSLFLPLLYFFTKCLFSFLICIFESSFWHH